MNPKEDHKHNVKLLNEYYDRVDARQDWVPVSDGTSVSEEHFIPEMSLRKMSCCFDTEEESDEHKMPQADRTLVAKRSQNPASQRQPST